MLRCCYYLGRGCYGLGLSSREAVDVNKIGQWQHLLCGPGTVLVNKAEAWAFPDLSKSKMLRGVWRFRFSLPEKARSGSFSKCHRKAHFPMLSKSRRQS